MINAKVKRKKTNIVLVIDETSPVEELKPPIKSKRKKANVEFLIIDVIPQAEELQPVKAVKSQRIKKKANVELVIDENP